MKFNLNDRVKHGGHNGVVTGIAHDPCHGIESYIVDFGRPIQINGQMGTMHRVLGRELKLVDKYFDGGFAPKEGRLEYWRAAENDLSNAYLRLRRLIPGAFDTPPGPSVEYVWQHTEKLLGALVKDSERLDWLGSHAATTISEEDGKWYYDGDEFSDLRMAIDAGRRANPPDAAFDSPEGRQETPDNAHRLSKGPVNITVTVGSEVSPPRAIVDLLRRMINLCAIGDLDENSDDPYGWGPLVAEAKQYVKYHETIEAAIRIALKEQNRE